MSLDDFLGNNNREIAKYEIIESPSLYEAREFINKFKHRCVLIVFANCEIEYEGRAKSSLTPGDRLIITKPDGTILVHEDKKRMPINWQPPGSKIIAKEENNKLVIYSKRDKPKEELFVKVDEVYFIACVHISRGRFKLIGSEKDMVDFAVKHPEIIEEGLRIIKREAPTPYGYIDLVGIDKDGNTVILEFKRVTATLSAVLQLSRYVSYYEKVTGNKLRAILVAPGITDDALILLRGKGFKFVKLDPKVAMR